MKKGEKLLIQNTCTLENVLTEEKLQGENPIGKKFLTMNMGIKWFNSYEHADFIFLPVPFHILKVLMPLIILFYLQLFLYSNISGWGLRARKKKNPPIWLKDFSSCFVFYKCVQHWEKAEYRTKEKSDGGFIIFRAPKPLQLSR